MQLYKFAIGLCILYQVTLGAASPVYLSDSAILYANKTQSCGVAVSLGSVIVGNTLPSSDIVYTILGSYSNTSATNANASWIISVWYQNTANTSSLTLRGYVLDSQCQNGVTISSSLYRYDCYIMNILRIFIANGSNVQRYFVGIQPAINSNITFTLVQQNVTNSSTPYETVCRFSSGGTTSSPYTNETIIAFMRLQNASSPITTAPTLYTSPTSPTVSAGVIVAAVFCSLILLVPLVLIGYRSLAYYRNYKYKQFSELTDPDIKATTPPTPNNAAAQELVPTTYRLRSEDSQTPQSKNDGSSSDDDETSTLVGVDVGVVYIPSTDRADVPD